MDQSPSRSNIGRFRRIISYLASARDGRFGPEFIGAGFALILLKLWLVSAQRIYAIGFAQYDDALFLRLANYLIKGKWLGPYDYLTLAKGPMYPLFIAATYELHIPLFTAQQLLYSAACVLFVTAIRPMVSSRAVRFALFGVLLFNPVTYDTVIHARVLRQDIIYSLTLMILAGLMALYARRDSARRMLPWSLLVGATLPAFWLTREESVWMLPCVLILWLSAVATIWRPRAPGRGIRLACLALPGLMWASGLALVADINFRHYGIFTTCEFNDQAMKAAYGALTRVKSAQRRQYLPVPREVRERLYPISPTFATLRPELEGPTGEGWAGITEFLTHRPQREREIASVWFIWAMRRAVYDTGQAHNGKEAMAFYERMAKEINSACDRGLIKADPPRTGYLPPMNRRQWEDLPSSLVRSLREIISFDHMSTIPLGPSLGGPKDLALFAKLTRGRLIPSSDGIAGPPLQNGYNRLRTGILQLIYQFYHWVAPWAGGLALLAWLAAIGTNLARRQRKLYFAIISLGLLGSIIADSAIVALIDISTFPSIETGYFSGTYALWLLFIFTGCLSLREVLQDDLSIPTQAPPPQES
jgi:hypothetical protein